MTEQPSAQPLRFFWYIVCLYVTFQLVSDVIAGKLIGVAGFPVSVTVIFFPVTYIFADILTEVYGYARARQALWTVLACSVIAGTCYQIAAAWPPAPQFASNEAYKTVLYQVPRILLGGWLAVFAGEFANNYVLAKMKVWTKGRHLWSRTISSTVVGQLVNTAVFYVIALGGILPAEALAQAIVAGWIIKTAVEVLFTPVTYLVVSFLKRSEGVDVFDKHTNFSPFRLRLKDQNAE